MKNGLRRYLVMCLVFLLVIPGGIFTGANAQAEEIVIFHTNDIHGAVAFSEGSSIGLDRVAALKNQTDNSILVDAGDATQGLPFASLTQGADVIRIMNEAGYDVMAAGNHEFDYGVETLLNNVRLADFPVLSANVYKDGQGLLATDEHNGCHVIIERAGRKIGFFGLITSDTMTSTNPVGIQGVSFTDEVEAAKREIDELTAEGADVIIAVAHLGEFDDVLYTSADLAQAMTGDYSGKLDVIIDGHSHTVETETVNDVLIMQTGTGLANLGKITLRFGADNEPVSAEGEILTYEDVVAITEPDASVAAKIDAVTSEMMGLLTVPVAESASTLWGGTVDGVAEARVVETNLGSFAADAYRDAAERFIAQVPGMEAWQGLPVIGAENGGGIRASLLAGTITKGDLISVFPFSNTLMIKQITPAILFETLEASVSGIEGQDSASGLLSGNASGGFLQVSGIRFSYDPAAPVGSKVQEVILEADGTKLDRADTETKLMLVSNNFIMNGGSGHAALAELPLLGEIGGELETVEAYLAQQAGDGVLPHQKVCNRIVPAGSYIPADYTAVIMVVDSKGNPAADTPVEYHVDGGEAQQGLTDAEGRLTITLTDGPHAVKLAADAPEAYINNYSGAGTAETEYRGFPTLVLPADDEAADWIVADLIGAIVPDTELDLKDDFYAAVNKEWFTTAEIPDGYVSAGAVEDRQIEVRDQIHTLLNGETGESHEAQLVQTLYAQYTDMEARNAQGVAPLRERIDRILEIESLSDLVDYQLDPANRLSSSLTYVTLGSDFTDSTVQRAWISAPLFTLGDADEYRNMTPSGEIRKAANEVFNVQMLTYADFSEEEALRIHSDAFSLETQIALSSLGTEATYDPNYINMIYNPVTIEELKALSPNYPIADMLNSFVKAGVDTVILGDPDWLATMNELYVEENVERIKAYLICDLASYMSDILDQTCLDFKDEWNSTVYGMEIVTDIKDAAYEYCSGMLDMLVGKMYADAYVSEETKADVETMVADIVAVYRTRLENNDWLTEETRQAAIRKLDNLNVRVAYPNDWTRYTAETLTLDGNNLADNASAMLKFSTEHMIERLTTPSDGEWWITTPQTVNAFYDAADNSINIPAGMLGGLFYDPQASYEANMGGIGVTIAHEITHAFDDFGSQFDEKGNLANWWTEADALAFYARIGDVAAYYSQFEIFPGVFVNGELVVGEAVADLGAMSCMLEIAAAENFDYEQFFESYAVSWREMMTAETLESMVYYDSHPPCYLRVNGILQHFQEFHEAYGIEEGDGMYLVPQERLSVW